ncbi:MAG: histidine kinase [Bacteroidota bacterium]
MFKCRASVIITFLIFTLTGSAQHFYSRNFTINEGLPSNIIHSVLKDSRGIMWIGTGGGLCRFDGTNFQVYNTSHGLVGDNVYSIAEDKNGDLWIGCMAAGISRFNGRKFYNYTTKNGLVSNNVRIVWYSKKFDVLMIGTNDGCSAMEQGKFVSFTSKEWNPESVKIFVTGFLDGLHSINVYAYSSPIRVLYDPEKKRYRHTGEKNWSYATSVSPLILASGDTISGAGRNGMLIYNKQGISPSLGAGQVFGLSADARGNVWIAGWADPMDPKTYTSGLFRYDGKTAEPLSEKTGITDRSVWTVYYDTSFHQAWAGTLNQGLFKIPEPCFTWYDTGFFKCKSLIINDLQFDRTGTLWIAANTGLIRKFSDNHVEIIDPSGYLKSQLEIWKKSAAVLSKVYLDRQGSFEKYEELIRNGSWPYINPYLNIMAEFGATRIEPPGSLYSPKEYQRYLKLIQQYSSERLIRNTCLGKDTKGNIYASNIRFINKFSEEQGYQLQETFYIQVRTTIFAIDKTDTLFIGDVWHKGVFIAALFPTFRHAIHPYCGWEEEKGPPNVISMAGRGNEIWCGSRSEGLFRMIDGQVDAFNTQDSSLPKIITEICFDQQGNVIAGGINGEIIIAKTEGRKLTILHRISSVQGLTGSTIQWMLVDHDNMLYAGTNQGLNRIDLNRLYHDRVLHINFYDQDEGYYDYTGSTAEIDSSGNIWVGTASHLLMFNPRQLSSVGNHQLNFQISGLDVNNMPFLFPGEAGSDGWSVSPVPSWKFSHTENSLTFYLEGQDFSNPGHIMYRYRLDGLNNGWSQFTTDHKAVFTNLDPGKYILKAECYNKSDNLKIMHIEYPFTIRRPWYSTWWFIAVSIILIFTSAYGIFLWRIKLIKKRAEERNVLLLQVSRMEMEALQAQMKPHFIFNAINSMQSYILNNNIDKALHYLSVFSKLIRKTLENASKEFIPIVEELDYLKYYIEIEKMRFEGLFEYEIHIAQDLPVETTLIPPMIAQLFIENSIKHGLMHRANGGFLLVELSRERKNIFKMVIQDNGVGRKQSQEMGRRMNGEHKSLGLQISVDRIRLLNETHHTEDFKIIITDLEGPDGMPSGTRVEFLFPEMEM